MSASTKEVQALGSIWYHVGRWSTKPEEFTVVKKTSATVWFKNKDWEGKELDHVRQMRIGDEWFQTKREALLSIRKRLERSEEYTRGNYSQAVQKLKEFNVKHAGELG